jgi:tetratricopeptide (TPR) repeat protein
VRDTSGLALGLGAALVLVGDLPGLFTRGDALRSVLLALLTVAALAQVLRRTDVLRGLPRAAWLLVLAPCVAWPAMLAISRPSLATAGALARGAGPWLLLAALTLGALPWLRAERAARRTWGCLLGAGALAGLWTYLGWLDGGVGAGPFGRPGVAGPVLGALLGPALLVPLPGRAPLRAAVAVSLAAGCVVSASRTGWAAGGLSVLLAVVFAPPGAWGARPRRWAAGLALVGGLAAALLLTGVLVRGGDTLEVRRGVWRASATLVAERPLLGHGLGAFRAEILRVRDLEEARLSRGREPYMAHNDVLHASVEGGLLAGLALVLWGLLSVRVAWRAARARPTDALAAAAACVLPAQLAAAMVEQVLPDPAHVLLAALAWATSLARLAPAPTAAARTPRLVVGVAALAALLALGTAALRARDAAADLHLRSFRDAIAGGLTTTALEREARERLQEGVLRWRADHPEGLYRWAVSEAELGRLGAAREAWRRALEVEPALTEARLDLAHSYVLERRRADAEAVLVEARRFDPTRYDLVLRQGHVALGPEPVPGGTQDGAAGGAPQGGFDPIEPLRHYNEAQALAPDRFETEVAFARVARRIGDLESAGMHLRTAESRAGPVGEVLFESFHLAEVEGRADERVLAAILVLALAADVGLAPTVRREAMACEAAAKERGHEARTEALFDNPRWKGVERAWSAFTVRALALLQARLTDADLLVGEARQQVQAGDFAAALARQRALLAFIGDDVPAAPDERRDFFERRGNLLIEAAQAASRTDGALARAYYAEGHLLKGLEFLERGALPEARRLLGKATEDAPDDARGWVALARAHARSGDLEAAEAALLEAVKRVPEVKDLLPGEPDLAQVLPREKVRAALGR